VVPVDVEEEFVPLVVLLIVVADSADPPSSP